MIFAGKMTEKLSFYRIEERQGKSGFKSTEEVLKFTTNAERLKNQEYLTTDADETFHYLELTFRMRNRSIEETDIVVYNNERYRINSIDRYPRDNEAVIKVMKINE